MQNQKSNNIITAEKSFSPKEIIITSSVSSPVTKMHDFDNNATRDRLRDLYSSDVINQSMASLVDTLS